MAYTATISQPIPLAIVMAQANAAADGSDPSTPTTIRLMAGGCVFTGVHLRRVGRCVYSRLLWLNPARALAECARPPDRWLAPPPAWAGGPRRSPRPRGRRP